MFSVSTAGVRKFLVERQQALVAAILQLIADMVKNRGVELTEAFLAIDKSLNRGLADIEAVAELGLERAVAAAATKRDAVEYALIHLNPALNFVTYPCEMYLMTVGLKFPNLLYRAALSAQCVYDAYWLTRLVSSVKRYRASYKAGDDKGDSPGEKEHEAILKRQASH